MRAQRVAKWGGCSTPRSGRFIPWKDPIPLYRRLDGPQGRSGQVRKISPSPGFDPLTAQPVASLYTVYAVPAPIYRNRVGKSSLISELVKALA